MNYIKLLCDLYQMKRNVGKTREEIRKLQSKKLKELLLYAYDHSEYYRKTFEKAGITRKLIPIMPLSAFPILDKQLLLEHFDELVTASDLKQEDLRRYDKEVIPSHLHSAEGGKSREQKTFKGKYHVVHSSGSTGTPGYFVYGESAWEQMLLGIIRAALWDMTMPEICKLLWKGPRIVYIAATDGRYGGAMAVGDGIKGVHASQLFLDVKTPLTEWIRQIQDFKPNMVIGYPSAIKILGELVENKEVELQAFRVISCGEPLGAGLRKYLEETFKADVVNIYGASESLALGVETSHADGMVLFDDLNIIEVENGSMYLTSLYNFVQPLIRYCISDQLKLREPDEKNPYPFTMAGNITGRNEDLMWFENEGGSRDFLHPLVIEGFCLNGLLDYQFRQLSKTSFEMLAEVSDGRRIHEIRSEMIKQMGQILKEKHLEYVDFSIRFVDEIRPDRMTGKKRLIVA
ncbi:phenylacetate--CoA ligase family protein [Clostridium sp. AM58-1XD]|uniref:phenylacetate--CoA ligase family protein n=1 Tax=Clostridium sp. AM58-1XD TaxID=2292307 RepID=UPI000E556BBF|nr:phenylacetate--CoA ligase family protein [Clostridium sp. AM58-1XD]RGY97930.1 phenylacetate--CoA ligase family protein [Clostridium sp. AM58-1XD]